MASSSVAGVSSPLDVVEEGSFQPLLRRAVLPMVYSSLWSMWATDLLRQAKALLNKNPLIHEFKIIKGVFITTSGSSFGVGTL